MTKLSEHISTLESIHRQVMENAIKQHEDRILNILAEHGYTFENRMELVHFAKTRCEVLNFTERKVKVLRVDGKPICEWYDTVRFENDGVNFKVIMGEPT